MSVERYGVYMYRFKLPNYESNKHFFFTDTSKYIDQLKWSNFISINNYRLNDNLLKLSLNDLTNYYEITYIIERISDDNIRCYYVKDYFIQGGMIYLVLEMDLWGSYIYHAKFEKIFVSRTNKRIGTGYYDAIEKCVGNDLKALFPVPIQGDGFIADSAFYWRGYAKDADFSIAFAINLVVAQDTSIANKQKVTATYMLACPLNEIRALFASNPSANGVTSLELAIRAVSGIVNTTAVNDQEYTLNAQVLNAFIIPTSCVSRNEWFTLNAKTPYTKLENIKLKGYVLKPQIARFAFELKREDFDIDYKYYAGVKGNGLELRRTTENDGITYVYTINNGSVRVVVKQGDNEKDITSDFTIALAGESAELTTNEKMANSLQTISEVLSASKGIVSASNPADGAFAFAQGALGLTAKQMSQTAQASGTIGTGSGAVTFGSDTYYSDATKTYVSWPYYLTKRKSVVNEKLKARRTGANVNLYINSYEDLLNVDYLGVGENENDNQAYIESTCICYGIPLDAQNHIKNELKNGIYFDYIK